jgi:hypothetical protein
MTGTAPLPPTRGVIRLGDQTDMHTRSLDRITGYHRIWTHEGCLWIELELALGTIPEIYALEYARLYRHDETGLWIATVLAVNDDASGHWQLSSWKQVEHTTDNYPPGITLRFGFHCKHLPQLQ